MSWFKYFKRDFDLSSTTPVYVYPPLRRPIDIYNPFDDIEENQIIGIKLDYKDFYNKISTSAEKEEDKKQYIVIHEDVNSGIYTAVRSTVLNGYLYFLSAKNHEAGVDIVGEYNLYYGNDHLKYLEEVQYDSKKAYRQVSESALNNLLENPSLYDTSLYNLNISNLDNYLTEVNANEPDIDKQQFSYFNQSVDWLGYKTTKINAKVSGSFNGPFLKIKAYKKPNGGKVRLKIIKSKQDYYILGFDPSVGPIEQTEEVYLDWTEIDLYSSSIEESIIYNDSNLENKKYYFLIETLEQDNKSSNGNEVEMINFQYLKAYDLILGAKEYDPAISFKG